MGRKSGSESSSGTPAPLVPITARASAARTGWTSPPPMAWTNFLLSLSCMVVSLSASRSEVADRQEEPSNPIEGPNCGTSALHDSLPEKLAERIHRFPAPHGLECG